MRDGRGRANRAAGGWDWRRQKSADPSRRRVPRNDATQLGQRGHRVEIALAQLHAARDRMDVRIVKAREQHAAAEVHRYGSGARERQCAVARADVHDAAAIDRDGFRARARAVNGVDNAMVHHEVGGIVRLVTTCARTEQEEETADPSQRSG
jgi:hypothetical protein